MKSFSEVVDAPSFINFLYSILLIVIIHDWGQIVNRLCFLSASVCSAFRPGRQAKRDGRSRSCGLFGRRRDADFPARPEARGGYMAMATLRGEFAPSHFGRPPAYSGLSDKARPGSCWMEKSECRARESVGCRMGKTIQKFVLTEKPPPLAQKQRGYAVLHPPAYPAEASEKGGLHFCRLIRKRQPERVVFIGCLPTAPAERQAAGRMCLPAAESACPGQGWAVAASAEGTRQAVFRAGQR